MTKEIPKAVQKLASNCWQDYLLILWLDQSAYSEFSSNDKKYFSLALKDWASVNLPQLERSEYKIYIKGKNRLIESDLSTKSIKTIL